MGKISHRFCEYEKDQEQLIDFLLIYRTAKDVRLYPTIWRVRLLLTSRVWEPEKDTQIWENEMGQMIGFAMLWSRQPDSPYLVFDGFIHPKYSTKKLLQNMFKWGNERVSEIVQSRKQNISVYANGFSQGNFADQIQNEFDYVPITPNPEEHNVYFARGLGGKITMPRLPDGYTVQRLQDTNNVAAYESLYGFAKVNPFHQKELLESDEYSHLVVLNRNGDFLAYCECSICRPEWKTTNTRLGWIDYVETKSAFQRSGFGQVALAAGLAQLRDWGAETAMLITVNTNTPATKLYHKAGFEPVEIVEALRYQKQISYTKM